MTITDGAWELVTYDPKSGRTVWRYFDGAATHYRTDYPVQSLVDENSQHFNASDNKPFADGKRIASIPLNIFYAELLEAQKQGDKRYLSRWLNDADHRAFRTFAGQV